MKFKYFLFFIFLVSLIFPVYSKDTSSIFNLQQYQKQIEANIIASQSAHAKKEMLDALYTMKNYNGVDEARVIINFATSMKNNMRFLPNREKRPFLKYLRQQLADEKLIARTDWYFLTEESLAKPNFTQTTAARSAEIFVDRLYEVLFSNNSKNLENAVRVLKQDIIKLVSQGDTKLLETFVNSYISQAGKYGEMSRSLNLFLSECMNHNLPLTLMRFHSTTSESLARNTIPAVMKYFSWNSFLTENQGMILQDLFRSKATGKFKLSNFTQMISDTYLSKNLPQAERELLGKISVLNDFAKVSDPIYQEMKPQARNGFPGQRSMFREQALEVNFGDLTPQNARELSEMLKTVPVSRMEPVINNARGWVEGFSRWAEKTIRPRTNLILSIGTMVAIVAAEELIRSYTNYNPSNAYLTITDEITDALAIGNNVKLVYNTVYYDNFAQYFFAYVEEGNLTEQEQLAYLETFDNFERAIYADYFQASQDSLAEQDWQCFALNENCVDEA